MFGFAQQQDANFQNTSVAPGTPGIDNMSQGGF